MRIFFVPGTSLLVMATMIAPAAQAQSYPAQSYPTQSYPARSYPAQSYPAQGYPAQGYPAQPYDQASGDGQQFREAPPYRDVAPDGDAYRSVEVAPPGYDGTQPPPPPPGYVAGQRYGERQYVDQDRRYEAYVEDWSQRYCTKARSNAGTGAVIGGLFGALLGAGVSGYRNQGTGALVGGLAGAAGGAVVGGSTANQTSPGCPPGFVVRGDAPAFTYDGYASGYDYAAPGWYRPWAFYDGRWAYRPYPYHAFFFNTYGYGRGYGRGYVGRGYGGRFGGYGYRRGRY